MRVRSIAFSLIVLSLTVVFGTAGCSGGPGKAAGGPGQSGSSGEPGPLNGGEDPASVKAGGTGARDAVSVPTPAPPDESPPAPADSAVKTKIESSTLDETVAVVRGEKITMKQLLEELLDLHGADMLDDMVTKSLVAQEWQRLGITFSAQEMEQRIEQEIELRRKELKEQTGAPDAFEAFLGFHGHTTDSFRQLLRTNENFANQIRLEHWFVLTRMTQDMIEVQHILLDTEAAAADALEKIQKGADFARLAVEMSRDTLTTETGGKLTAFVRGLSPLGLEFDEAAFALKNPGDLSGVVKSQVGYHVIKLLSRTPGANRTYESLRSEVLRALSAGLPDKSELRRWYENYRKMNREQVEVLFKKKG